MILLTGANGFLGREVLRKLVLEGKTEIGLVLRDSKSESAEERFRTLTSNLFSENELRGAALSLISGDVALPHFGIGEGSFQRLAGNVTQIYHCAASTNLQQSLAEARAANVASVNEILNLARAAGETFEHLFHVSTAYVAGDTERTVRAGELSFQSGFRNGYEQSKAEAELLLAGAREEIPHTVFRPSIIVGNSETGHTSSFNVIYVPAKLIAKGAMKTVPAKPFAPFDVVPVDYVADAIFRLSRLKERSAQCYHLCAGVGRESTPWEILEFLIKALERYSIKSLEVLHAPAFISPELLAKIYASIRSMTEVARSRVRGLERAIGKQVGSLGQTLPFLPYMIQNPRFDTSETVCDLGGLKAPLFSEYAERLFRYCAETDWGRLPLATAAAR